MSEYSIVTDERELYEDGYWETYKGFSLVEGVWDDAIFVGEYARVNRLHAWLSEMTDLLEGSKTATYKGDFYDVEVAIYERAELLSDSEALSILIVSKGDVKDTIRGWRDGKLNETPFDFSEEDEYKVLMTQEPQGDESWYFADTENLHYVSVVREMRDNGVYAHVDQGNTNAYMPLMSGTREDVDRFMHVLRLVSEHRELIVDFEAYEDEFSRARGEWSRKSRELPDEDVAAVYKYIPMLCGLESSKFSLFQRLKKAGFFAS